MTLPASGRPFDATGLAAVLAAVDGWRAGRVAVAVVDRDGLVAAHGPQVGAGAPVPFDGCTPSSCD